MFLPIPGIVRVLDAVRTDRLMRRVPHFGVVHCLMCGRRFHRLTLPSLALVLSVELLGDLSWGCDD